jgi:hypothetical protein
MGVEVRKGRTYFYEQKRIKGLLLKRLPWSVEP